MSKLRDQPPVVPTTLPFKRDPSSGFHVTGAQEQRPHPLVKPRSVREFERLEAFRRWLWISAWIGGLLLGYALGATFGLPAGLLVP
jgi:hypothetical protein